MLQRNLISVRSEQFRVGDENVAEQITELFVLLLVLIPLSRVLRPQGQRERIRPRADALQNHDRRLHPK